MKKITLLLLFLISFSGFSQLTEDFEDGFPVDWLRLNAPAGPNFGIGAAQQWMLNTTPNPVNPSGYAAHTGLDPASVNAAYINTEQIGINNTEEDWMITSQQLIPANGQLRFFTRQVSNGNQGTVYQIRASLNPLQNNQEAFTIIQTWTESDLQDLNGDITQYVEKTVDFPAQYIGQQIYIAFVRTFLQPTSQRAGDRWLIDDVRVRQKCVSPNGLDIGTNIQSTIVELVWNNLGLATTFEIEIVPSGQIPTGTGFVVTAEGINPTSYTTTTSDIVLQPGVCYEYYVRAICGTADDPVYSGYGGPFPFCTLPLGSICNDPLLVSGLPFQSSGNTANFGDEVDITQGTLCGAVPANTNYLQGNEVFYSYTATIDGTISITMTPAGTPSGNSSLFVYNGCANVGVNCIAGVANANSTPRIVTIPVVNGQTYIIVISSSAINPTVGFNLVIQREECTPKPINLAATDPLLDTATLSWVSPEFAAWEVEVQPLNAPVPTGNGAYYVTTTTFQPSGLASGTQYQFWVRAECTPGSGIFTAWAGPFTFNTQICAVENQCTHIFRMTDSANNGWNGARMQIRQNGIVLATIGATYTSGAGPVDIPVQMCNTIGYDIFWLTAGTQPQQCIVSVVNSFGQTIFTKTAGTGTPGGVIFTEVVNCTVPECDIPPTNVQVPIANINTTNATVTWVAPATTSWDIYVVPAGSAPPTADTAGGPYDNITVADVNNPSFELFFNSLLADTAYDVYVRVNCDNPAASNWTGPTTFTTLPTCPKPIALGVLDTTTTSTTLLWTNGTPTDTLWEVLLVPSPTIIPPTTLPPLNPVVGNGTLLIPTTTASPLVLPLGTLTPATIYFYYIRTVCPGDDKSTWSGPFIFNTVTCEPQDKCAYKFLLTDAEGNGWNGARMQVRQNGILIATIGATFANGAGPVTVSVPLCTNVPFDLFWSVAGTAPDEVGVAIQNPFTDIIFTKAPGISAPLEVVYASVASCTPPTCPKPTTLLVTAGSITQTSAELSWTENAIPGATQWEVYAVPVGSAPPPVNGTPVSGVAPYYIANSNPYIISGLLPGTTYIYYVRALCSGTDISTWTILNPKTFTTKPLNDECEFSTVVPVNPTRVCAQFASGSTLGATRSLPNTAPVCPGNTDDDIWFTFTATSTIHIITISDIIGGTTDINHTLYTGSDCGALTQLYCSNPNVSIANNLIPLSTYKIRVYTNGSNVNQTATFNLCITTPPAVTNDECATAITAVVNNGIECNVFTSASITGATASSQTSTCAGAEDDDIWFSFTANSPTQIITLSNIQGTSENLVHALYQGDVCGNLTFLYCSDPEESIAEDLIVGAVYKIRVWSSVATLQDITFDLCIGRILPPITANTTQYTKQQLIEDIFLKSTCLNVTNITWSTGSDFNNVNGIGYFNKSLSDFPYQDGIVLSTGDAASSPGPNLSLLSEGGPFDSEWIVPDPDLEAIVLAATGNAMNSKNVTKLEFDFTPLSNLLKFNFIFASEEYGDFQCTFSDSFAFLLTNLETNETVNLATVVDDNGVVSPISVVTIRDAQYNTAFNDCESVNPEKFGTYYGDFPGTNPLGAPINFDGHTVDIEINAPIIPGVQYHIKLVIADRQDTAYDSAIFLEGGSFNIGNVELGNNFLEADGTAVCLGDTVTIDSALDPETYTFQWFNGDDEIEGETNPVLVVNEAGTYSIKATYTDTDCFAEDVVLVEYFQDAIAGTPQDLIDCNSAGTSIFDLTINETLILAPFLTGTHDVVYFLTADDAENNITANAITTPNAFAGTNGQTIYVRINKTGTTCNQIVSFLLNVQDLTPQFTLSGVMAICPEATTTIAVVPTDNNFDVNLVTFTWFYGGNIIFDQNQSTLVISGANYGDYSVTVNNNGCTANQTFAITNSNTDWAFNLTPSVTTLCPDETGTIAVNVTNNPAGATATYTYTLPNSSTVVSENSVLPIDSSGQYGVTVEILGCTSTQQFITIGESVGNWEVTFVNEPYIICPNQSVNLSFTADNFEISNPNAVYTWTLPDNSEVSGTTLTANQVGDYTLKVDVLGCISESVVAVAENTSVIAITFESGCDEGNDFVLTALPLNSSFDPITSTYVWSSTSAFEPIAATPESIILNAKGDFTVTVINADGCQSQNSVYIADVSCKIQKGISPDNNGENDSFDLSAFDVKRLSIFNRYGTEVFVYDNYVDQWQGQSNSGEELPDGTYFYVIDKANGKNETGWIYINR